VMTSIYSIKNLHSKCCGKPPKIQKPEDGYLSYYENKYGEQWFVVGDYKSMTMTLVGGDVDWHEFNIDWDTIYFCGCGLNSFERQWLDSCIYTFFTLRHKESDIKLQMSKLRYRHNRRVDRRVKKILAELEAKDCAN